jgi:hypothetical protein
MAWTLPKTWAANEVVSASLLNTHVRDNMLETAPAKMTTAGDIVIATGANAIARLGLGSISNGAANPYYIIKTADESLTSSAALQNDDHLLLALAANEIWAVEFFFVAFSTSATPNLKFDFTVPAGAVGAYTVTYTSTAAVATIAQGRAFGTATAVLVGANTYLPIVVRLYVINGATPGNLQLRWAQNTSTGTATLVKQGSYLRAIKG